MSEDQRVERILLLTTWGCWTNTTVTHITTDTEIQLLPTGYMSREQALSSFTHRHLHFF